MRFRACPPCIGDCQQGRRCPTAAQPPVPICTTVYLVLWIMWVAFMLLLDLDV
jgi:hypothetical protein